MQDAKASVLGQIKNIKRRLVQGEEEEKVRLCGDKRHGEMGWRLLALLSIIKGCNYIKRGFIWS